MRIQSAAIAAGLLTVSVNAAELYQLDKLTVTETRLDTEVASSPRNVTIISAEQIQRSPAKTIPELISLEAGIFNRSTFGNNAARSTIDIRGFGASSTQNTLILLDGRRLNDVDLSNINYASIPLHNIERIEIIRGAGGVLYGDGAVGGAINIVTRRARQGEKAAVLKTTYGSYSTEQVQGAFKSGTENYSFNLAANYTDSNGYRKNNDYRQRNLQTDLRRSYSRGEVFLKAGISDQILRLPGNRLVDPTIGLNELTAARKGTNTPNDYANEDVHRITVGNKHRFNDHISTVIDVGYRFKNQKSFLEQGGFPNSLDTDLDVWSFTPRLNAEYSFLSIANRTVIGADIYRYNYKSETAPTFATINTPVHQIGLDQENYALYINNLASLTKATHLEFGFRLQHVNQDGVDVFDPTAPGGAFDTGAGDFSKSDTEEMFNVGIRHFLTDTVSVFANAGRSVRFATIDEIYQFNALFVRVFSVIEPQKSDHADIGIRFKNNELTTTLSAYYMDLENEIHFDPATFTNINLDPTERKGIETTLEYKPISTLTLRGNYAYTRSSFDEGIYAGNEVPLVPRHTASVSANWEVNSYLSLVSTWRYVGERRFDNDQTNDFGQKIPSYSFWDLKLSSNYQGWFAELAVNNLLEEEAFDYGARSTAVAGRYNAQPLPERNIYFTIGYNFDW